MSDSLSAIPRPVQEAPWQLGPLKGFLRDLWCWHTWLESARCTRKLWRHDVVNAIDAARRMFVPMQDSRCPSCPINQRQARQKQEGCGPTEHREPSEPAGCPLTEPAEPHTFRYNHYTDVLGAISRRGTELKGVSGCGAETHLRFQEDVVPTIIRQS